MIGRIWQGWTRPAEADRYENLLRGEILPGIAARNIPGFLGVQLFRRPAGAAEVEFVTIMYFDTWGAVKQFAGEDYEAAYVPPQAREVLSRFDERARHYEIKEWL